MVSGGCDKIVSNYFEAGYAWSEVRNVPVYEEVDLLCSKLAN